MSVKDFYLDVIRTRAWQRGQSKLSDDDRQKVADLAGDDALFCFVESVLAGDIELATHFWDTKGPFKAQIISKDEQDVIYCVGADSEQKLRDVPGMQSNFFEKIGSGAELRKLMELISEAFVGGDDPKSELYQHLLSTDRVGRLVPTDIESIQRPAGDDLPYLAGGELQRPELLLALHEITTPATADVLDQVVLWATPEMIASFPDKLFPYEQILEIDGEVVATSRTESITHGSRVRGFRMPLREASDRVAEFDTNRREGLVGTDACYARDPSKPLRMNWIYYGVVSEQNADHWTRLETSLAANWMCPAVAMGLGGSKDRILCRSTASFALSFDVADPDLRKLQRAQSLMANYFPADLASAVRCQSNGYQSIDRILKFTAYSRSLLSVLKKVAENEEVRREFLQEASPDFIRLQVDGLLDGSSHEFDPKILPVLRDDYGVTSSAVRNLSLMKYHVEDLKEQGYRFDDGLEITVSYSNSDDKVGITGLRQAVLDVIQMTDGVAEVNRVRCDLPPEGLLSKLASMRGRIKDQTDREAQTVAALAISFGVDAMVESAKTTPQWEVLDDLFGSNSLRPHMRKAPAALKTRWAGRTLGI